MTSSQELLRADYERRAWHADALIGSRLADARAHAERGDLPRAKERLDELGRSLTGALQDARGHFYRRAFALHRQAGLDPAVHQAELQPTSEGEQVARDAKIFGRTLQLDITGLIADSVAALTSVVLAANDPRTVAHVRGNLLGNWQGEQHRRLDGYSRRELSDAQIAIFNAVGRILVLPNLR